LARKHGTHLLEGCFIGEERLHDRELPVAVVDIQKAVVAYCLQICTLKSASGTIVMRWLIVCGCMPPGKTTNSEKQNRQKHFSMALAYMGSLDPPFLFLL